jgi:uncharacterized protein YndB with AHSA1/START domain
MRIRHQLTYAAPPDEVHRMLTDPAFRERVCEALDTLDHDVTVREAGSGATVRIDMAQRVRGVPGFARKVVGEQTRVVQTETWTDARHARLRLEIPGKPGHVEGDIVLEGGPGSSGTVETFTGEVTVSVPLVGGKLESVVSGLFVAGMDTEREVGTAWLAGERA